MAYEREFSSINICNFCKRQNLPLPRNPPQRRVLELLGVGVGVAQVTVGVEAAGEQIVEQALFDLAQFGDDALGLADGGVGGVQDLGDAALFGEWGDENRESFQVIPRCSGHSRTNRSSYSRVKHLMTSEYSCYKASMKILSRSQDKNIGRTVSRKIDL